MKALRGLSAIAAQLVTASRCGYRGQPIERTL